MVELAFVLGEELYYGFILTGAKNCFLVRNLLDLKQSIETIRRNKEIALVFLDKQIEKIMEPQETKDLLSSVSPLFFEIDSKGNLDYNKQVGELIKVLGVRLDGS